MLDARAYGDRLLPVQQGAAVVFRLMSTGEALSASQVARMCGFRDPSNAHRLMNDLAAIWPALVRRRVLREDGKGYRVEWYWQE
jgi:hypothetical protein